MKEPVLVHQPNEPNEWDDAPFLTKWSFSAANPMLNKGMRGPLQFNDLSRIPNSDYSRVLMQKLKHSLNRSEKFWFFPRLLVALFRISAFHWLIVSVALVLEGILRIGLPVALIFFLRSLENGSRTAEQWGWAAVISALSLSFTIIHHVAFFYSMRIGWNWKTACTALIHDSLFKLDTAILQTSGTGTGKLVNLISNDVQRFEEFAVFAGFVWEAMLELVAVLVILIVLLDPASAVAGVAMSLLNIPVTLYFAKLIAKYRGQTAAATDQRVRHISELIDGIASVKSFAWETPFFRLIRTLRSKETHFIGKSQILRAMNMAFMYSSPAVISFVMFTVFWAQGGRLELPIIFATMSFLLTLRLSVGVMWTRGVETGSEALASCYRIEQFLALSSNVREDRSSNDESVSPNDVSSSPADSSSESEVLTVSKSSFFYGKSPEEGSVCLSDVEFSVRRGEIVLVVGPVGSGKSSLLSAVLGEIAAVQRPDAVPAESAVADHAAIEDESKSCIERCRVAKSRPVKIQSGARIAFCAQRPWILAASVKANVALSGSANANTKNGGHENDAVDFKKSPAVDPDLYAKAVQGCLLVDDFTQWPAYDETEVGERGISISGGQKARLSLARAVYADADLYLLDDPLSAVDAHVGKALFFSCIKQTLSERQKAVLLVTHQLQYMKHADRILVLDANGRQLFFDTYEQLVRNASVCELLHINPSDANMQEVDADADAAKSATNDAAEPAGSDGALYNADFRKKVVSSQSDAMANSSAAKSLMQKRELESKSSGSPTKWFLGNRSKQLSALRSSRFDLNHIDDSILPGESEADSRRRQIIEKEDRAVGTIEMRVFVDYFRAGGLGLGALSIFMMVLAQVILMVQFNWLRWWASEEFGDQGNNIYPIIFAVLTLLTAIMGFYKSISWFRYSLGATSKLHEHCLWAVMHSPLLFFVANPTGRILNRFAKDQNQADEMLPIIFSDFMQCALYCIASVILVCVTIPWLILLIPFLLAAFYMLRDKYMHSQREIKRWESVTRSPIYADFSATIDGLATLRAYKLELRIAKLFQQQIDMNGRAWFSYLLAARWLGFRLDFESATIVAFVAFFAVILRDTVDVGLIGFTLVYTMSLSGLFQWTVRQSAEVETQMTSVERIFSYGRLPPEEGYRTTLATVDQPVSALAQPSTSTPDSAGPVDHGNEQKAKAIELLESFNSNGRGDLELVDMTVRYRNDLDPVLKNINLKIPAGSKVGICGRTGSGKSSTLLALLRLNIISHGDILYDDLSILEMDLELSRKLIAIIPQEPHLFCGTVRFNMDPFSNFTDLEIWNALADAHIKAYLLEDALGLDAIVEEGGKNFSVGQRQLLSLARAILRKCRVVLMDEVTASIDFATDGLIQETIRTSPVLSASTIITVAHRLRTIADSDLIVVIDKGNLVEQGTPLALLHDSKSHFSRLATKSNEYDEIFRIALQAEKHKLECKSV